MRRKVRRRWIEERLGLRSTRVERRARSEIFEVDIFKLRAISAPEQHEGVSPLRAMYRPWKTGRILGVW